MKIKDGEPVVIDIAGAEVSLSAAVITEMFLERLREASPVESIEISVTVSPPAIGATWHGGIYAGVARGEDGAQDHHLIVLEEAQDEKKWAEACTWAATVGDGLPTRRELALCYANVPDVFATTWYWSSTQSAGDEAYAWCQSFGDGSQGDTLKGSTLRARAVRRVVL